MVSEQGTDYFLDKPITQISLRKIEERVKRIPLVKSCEAHHDFSGVISISVKEYNWSLSPSSMHQDKVLVNDLTEDNVIKQLYIYKPQNEFGEIVNKIKDINKGVSVPRTLTEKNIDKIKNEAVEGLKSENQKALDCTHSGNCFYFHCC